MRDYSWVAKLKPGDKVRLRPIESTGDSDLGINNLSIDSYLFRVNLGITVTIVEALSDRHSEGHRQILVKEYNFATKACRFEPMRKTKVFLNGTGKMY